MNEKFSKALGHQTKCYSYGNSVIKDGKVAVIAGGGNDIIFLEELVKNDVRVLITGISAINDRYKKEGKLYKVCLTNVIDYHIQP